MQKLLVRAAVSLSVVLLSGCASKFAPLKPYPVIGEMPPIGTPAHASQGDVIFQAFDYTAVKAIKVLEDVAVSDELLLPANTVLRGDTEDVSRKGQRYCAQVESGGRSHTCCLIVPPEAEHVAAMEVHRSDRPWSLKKPSVKSPIRIGVTEVVASPLPRSMVRQEVVFQGAAAGVLRLLYREYAEDLIRPAFSQELTYDYVPGPAVTVAVKSAQFEVRRAGNAGIDYRVLKSFR